MITHAIKPLVTHWRVQCLVVLLSVLLVTPSVANTGLSNQMKNHPSPYLAMHGNDPVAWQLWGKGVLERAKKENKLLFVSVGYFSCHWCHVMQRESYSDKKIAGKLNRDFIPVKIDRELFPALDAYLIEFVQRTRGHAGWPLNVFVTPEGYPVVGVVYLPKLQLTSLLTQISDLWKKDSGYMQKMARQAAAMQNDQVLESKIELSEELVKRFISNFTQQAIQQADEMLGGFGDQTKFPMTSQLNTMISVYQLSASKPVKTFIVRTLEQMATQGLRDHIGGGFFRYTVDPDWQTPHFEKMLYDNANLAMLYLRAATVFGRADFAAIGRETLDFMIRDLATTDGAMVSSLSAIDDKGIEGGYYLWQKQQLKALLSSKEMEVLTILWDMDVPVPFEAGYLPKQIHTPDDIAKSLGVDTMSVMKTIGGAYQKLKKARKSRRVPIDTKQLAAWNGLALSALVMAANAPDGQKYHKAAQRVRNYLVTQLSDGGRLWRAKSVDGMMGQAGLEDYAYASRAMIDWAELSHQPVDYQIAGQWVDTAWKKFYTATGWQLTDESLLPGSIGVPIVGDNPMPSPSSMLIQTTLKLAVHNNDPKLKARSVAALSVGQGLMKTQAFDYPSQLQALLNYTRPVGNR